MPLLIDEHSYFIINYLFPRDLIIPFSQRPITNNSLLQLRKFIIILYYDLFFIILRYSLTNRKNSTNQVRQSNRWGQINSPSIALILLSDEVVLKYNQILNILKTFVVILHWITLSAFKNRILLRSLKPFKCFISVLYSSMIQAWFFFSK